MDPIAIIGILTGVVSTLGGAIVYLYREGRTEAIRRADAAAAELVRVLAERDRREALLIAERDEWKDRSLATDSRLDRVAAAFSRLAGGPAPD